MNVEFNPGAPANPTQFVGSNPGWHRTFETLTHDQLKVDPTIQRPVDERWVARIAKNFNVMAIGTLVASCRVSHGPLGERIETYVLLDGQQRSNAASRANYFGPFHVEVHHNLTLAEEATLFRLYNHKRNVPPVESFRIALAEGGTTKEGQIANGVKLVADGLKIPLSGPSGFTAPSVAIRIAEAEGGLNDLRWALSFLQEVYTKSDGVTPAGTYNGNVVEALALLHGRDASRLNTQNLITRFRRDGVLIEGLLGTARIQKGLTRTTSLIPHVINAIIDVFNKGRHRDADKMLPPWPIRSKSTSSSARTPAAPAA